MELSLNNAVKWKRFKFVILCKVDYHVVKKPNTLAKRMYVHIVPCWWVDYLWKKIKETDNSEGKLEVSKILVKKRPPLFSNTSFCFFLKSVICIWRTWKKSTLQNCTQLYIKC
jgi:hypothetical protein